MQQPNFRSGTARIDGFLHHASGLYGVVRYNLACVISSPFRPLCHPRLLPDVSPESGPAFDLIKMIETLNSHIRGPKTEFYVATVKSLTLILDIVASETPFGGAPPNALLLYLVHWLSFLPDEFIILVNSHDPKALVIMAHYYAVLAFVLSKWKRELWWMRERPVYMIEHIAEFLDTEWQVWMQWPVSLLRRCGGEDWHWGPVADVAKVRSEESAESELGVLLAVELHPCKMGEAWNKRSHL